eukprot:6880912-Ditylum_brightwellii.AAC.1
MEAELFKQNSCHFSQSTGTQITISPLLEQLGEYTKTKIDKELRNRMIDVETLNTDPCTIEL